MSSVYEQTITREHELIHAFSKGSIWILSRAYTFVADPGGPSGPKIITSHFVLKLFSLLGQLTRRVNIQSLRIKTIPCVFQCCDCDGVKNKKDIHAVHCSFLTTVGFSLGMSMQRKYPTSHFSPGSPFSLPFSDMREQVVSLSRNHMSTTSSTAARRVQTPRNLDFSVY